MAIKASLGKLKLPSTVDRFAIEHCEANGFRLLAITLAHITAVEGLPFHHRDPFDRLLVAQARHEAMTLVSRNPSLRAYGGRHLNSVSPASPWRRSRLAPQSAPGLPRFALKGEKQRLVSHVRRYRHHLGEPFAEHLRVGHHLSA